jgi:hypothetical protein
MFVADITKLAAIYYDMRRTIIPTLLLISLMSCNSRQTNETNKTSDNVFNEFINKIPSQGLPINLSCGLPSGPGSNNIQTSDFETYKEFIPSGQNIIFGTIGQPDKFKLIIYGRTGDDIYPTLFTYDNFGKRIDSLDLILNPCGAADESRIPHSFVSITKDLQIILTDTLKFIHYPDNKSNYAMDSLKVSTVKYTIDDRGQINKR